ncbi:CHAT domain-containing protein [Synechococcus sp. UW140]|uniref:CHAT domain-containing protein n=1 Tax=Synechococcus sp. UW140 TaxID=368503 RepID=UPI000E0FF0FD|nr:CHAT domain-containing protein [Synechococcus sp. UW140]
MRRLALLPLLIALSGITPAAADVASSRSGGLGTRINGALGGRCSSGVCRIDGGSAGGGNRFHRLSEFDTRGAIQGVSIESDGVRNLVLGVTAADGSFIDKSVSLTSPAHLFVLSPGGIQLMPGASFQQIPQLTLSTASQLRFGGGVFDVFSTPATGVAVLGGDPLPGALGLLPGALGEKRPWIRMDGISIDVDEALLVDAPGGRIDVEGSRLSVSNASGDGGTLTLTGELIRVGDGSELLATGAEKGGLIQVGGSWQNSDASVRQATQTWIQKGALVDASSRGDGAGGTVVIWSDLNNLDGGTVVEGSLLASGGPLGGDGGRIETSGPFLLANPEKVDVSSMNGLAGEWLLDPYNITIGASSSADIYPDYEDGGRLFESSQGSSTVSAASIEQYLGQGNVRILTGSGSANNENNLILAPNSAEAEGGNIVWQSGYGIDYSGYDSKLTLDAAGYIQLNSNITTGSGGLSLKAASGYVQGAKSVTLRLGGALEIETGDTTIGTSGFTSPSLASTFVGAGNLVKTGAGRLILSGNNSGWTGDAEVKAGSLRIIGANALGDSSMATRVDSGASLEISGDISVDEPITLAGGTLVNWSGDNTLANKVKLIGSSTIDLRQDGLTLNPSSGNALAVDVANSAYNSDLLIIGDGSLDARDPINLKDGQSSKTYGDLRQTGSGVLRFRDAIWAEKVSSTGGGTLWMDQESESEVIEGSGNSSIFLDNGSILRRDADETIQSATLELGSGGGGISVGDDYTLIWDAEITGSGDFSKEGEGTLRFPATAEIDYEGDTLVKAGRLDVLSASPVKATCSGTGASNRCQATDTDNDDNDNDNDDNDDTTSGTETAHEPTLQAVLIEAVADLPVLPPSQQTGSQASDPQSGEAGVAGSSLGQPQGSDASLVVDLGGTSDSSDSSVAATAAPSARGAVQTVTSDQAADQLLTTDQAATSRTAALLGLEQAEQALLPPTPTVNELQTVLQQVESQRLAASPAILQVRFTTAPEQQQGADAGFLDLTLISAKAPVEARRVEVDRKRFAGLLKALYRQLSRQEPMAVDNPASPTRQLHSLLVAPLDEALQAQGIQTLLIAADQGLQAVPFAALNDGSGYFGDRYAFALTPSLALTPLSPAGDGPQGQLALGASQFDGLAPLPLVPQELERIDASTGADRYLNSDFSPKALLDGAADQRYARVHVATHADFRSGGPERSVLHTGTGPMSMAQFARLRKERSDQPLDLVVLSACRTLLGDKDSELGFAGLALQAGARSAIGTLWYVDDVVTSAFFVQFYRLLDQGVAKAEALQRTRQLFSSGVVRLVGDEVIGAGGASLLNDLSTSQRRRIASGVSNPFFWAGIELIGSPW